MAGSPGQCAVPKTLARPARWWRGPSGSAWHRPLAVLIWYRPATDVLAQLRREGYALLTPALARAALTVDPAALAALDGSWEQLPRDAICAMPGATVRGATAASSSHCRRQRWRACRTVRTGSQPPTTPCTAACSAGSSRSTRRCWRQRPGNGCSSASARCLRCCSPVERWYIEAHQFRIDTVRGSRAADSGGRASRWRGFRRRRAGTAPRRARR